LGAKLGSSVCPLWAPVLPFSSPPPFLLFSFAGGEVLKTVKGAFGSINSYPIPFPLFFSFPPFFFFVQRRIGYGRCDCDEDAGDPSAPRSWLSFPLFPPLPIFSFFFFFFLSHLSLFSSLLLLPPLSSPFLKNKQLGLERDQRSACDLRGVVFFPSFLPFFFFPPSLSQI